MTQDDSYDNEEFSAHVKYSEEVAEQLKPIGDPVLGPDIYIRAEKGRINRVFYFLSFISVVCLATVMLRPQLPVELAVASIWAGAVALSRYLLSSAYGKT
ncbi:MAG: hypothetical protein WBQ71_17415 [Trebonia sp.]